jgi:hypothetical protein
MQSVQYIWNAKEKHLKLCGCAFRQVYFGNKHETDMEQILYGQEPIIRLGESR